MIIEKLIKLDKSKRIAIAVSVLLVAACFCYLIINRSSILKLQTAKANYISIETDYAVTKNLQAKLQNLQKHLEEKGNKLQKAQQKCFTTSSGRAGPKAALRSIAPVAVGRPGVPPRSPR